MSEFIGSIIAAVILLIIIAGILYGAGFAFGAGLVAAGL